MLVDAMIRKSTVKGLIVVMATLMLIHAGNGRPEEDEEEEDDEEEEENDEEDDEDEDDEGQGHLEQRLRTPPPTMPHERRVRDLMDTMAIERLMKRTLKVGLKNTEKDKSSVETEIQSLVKDTKSKFVKGRTEGFFEGLLKASKECDDLADTDDKCCKQMATDLDRFTDSYLKFSVQEGEANIQHEVQREKKKATLSELEEKIQGADSQTEKEKATVSELERTVSEKIADAEVSPKKLKQDRHVTNPSA